MRPKETDLSSSALQIYILLLKTNPHPLPFSKIKEITGLPKSTIHYNLDRLKKEGLVLEVSEGYIIKEFEQLPALRHYMTVFGKIVPRYILFSVFFFIMTIILLISEIIPQIKVLAVLLALLGLFGSVRLVYKFRL